MTVPSDAELDAMVHRAGRQPLCQHNDARETYRDVVELVAAVRSLRAESAKLTDIISAAVFEPREPLTWQTTPPGPEHHRRQCRIRYSSDETDFAYWDNNGQVWVVKRLGVVEPRDVVAWAGPIAEPGE